MSDAADTPGVTPSEAGSQAAAEAESESGPASAPDAKPESLTDAVADLLQMAVNYLRQETAGVMHDKVVLPGQRLGMMVAFALAASFLLALGLGFVAVALLLLLAQYLTWPGALGAIGGVLLVGAAVLTALKVRSMQQ
jgi:hypothetical protein